MNQDSHGLCFGTGQDFLKEEELRGKRKSWLGDSNPGPTVYETVALPTELSQHGVEKTAELYQKCQKIEAKT